MKKSKNTYAVIKEKAAERLLTPHNGRLPILCGMWAVFIWLCAAVGLKSIISSLPLDIPILIADILHLSVTLPLGVGIVRYIAAVGEVVWANGSSSDGTPCRTSAASSEIFTPFESAAAYTDAWRAALCFPLKAIKIPGLTALFIKNLWHIIPTMLSGGMWLFVFIPYLVTLTHYVCESENVDNLNNNINGETNQWTTKENFI